MNVLGTISLNYFCSFPGFGGFQVASKKSGVRYPNGQVPDGEIMASCYLLKWLRIINATSYLKIQSFSTKICLYVIRG